MRKGKTVVWSIVIMLALLIMLIPVDAIDDLVADDMAMFNNSALDDALSSADSLAEEDLNDGIIHTFKSQAFGHLMCLTSDSISAAITATAYDYTNTSAMWMLEYHDNGYYAIRNDVTGYYLTAPNSNINNASVMQATFNSTYSLWKIQKSSNGYYTIQSKNQYEAGSALYLSAASSGVVQSNSSITRRWDVSPLVMRMNVMYDQSFVDRYPNYLTVLSSVYSENSIGNSIADVLKERYGVLLRVTYSNSVYNSYPYIENCTYKTSVDTICKDCKGQARDFEAVECRAGYHHKAEIAMLDMIQHDSIQTSVQTNILFTDYKTCYGYVVRDENGVLDLSQTIHEDSSRTNAWSFVSGSGILVLADNLRSNFSNQNFDNVIRTTMHEMLHTVGVPHCDSVVCIMNSQEINVTQNLSMCEECQDVFEQNKLKLYNHQ